MEPFNGSNWIKRPETKRPETKRRDVSERYISRLPKQGMTFLK
jgi:hypothetical protein